MRIESIFSRLLNKALRDFSPENTTFQKTEQKLYFKINNQNFGVLEPQQPGVNESLNLYKYFLELHRNKQKFCCFIVSKNVIPFSNFKHKQTIFPCALYAIVFGNNEEDEFVERYLLA
jgi:hypothetical protein